MGYLMILMTRDLLYLVWLALKHIRANQRMQGARQAPGPHVIASAEKTQLDEPGP